MFQLAFHGGPRQEGAKIQDLVSRETFVLFLMIAALVGLGLYPRPLLRLLDRVVTGVLGLVLTGGGA